MYQVLLVDDEYMILAGLQKLINWESLNMEIAGTARNGKKALDFITENPVDIILTDVTMPVLSGIDFIREAKKLEQPFKFIILSGYQEFEYVKDGMQLGAANYLLKPIDKEELYQSLQSILKDFEQDEFYNQAEQTIFEGLVGNWVRNELKEDKLEQLMKTPYLQATEDCGFSIVIVRNTEKEWNKEFQAICKAFNLPLSFSLNEAEKVVVLATSDEKELVDTLEKVIEQTADKCTVFIGKSVENRQFIYQSYQSALDVKYQADFYGKQHIFNFCKLDTVTDLTLSGLVTDLNEGIFSKNIERITKEINLFIQRLQVDQMNAEDIKRLMYLVLVNIYLQFDAIESDKFLKKTKALFEAETFNELTEVMETDLLPLDELKKQLLYSDLTKQIIQIVQTEYMEDLTLKSIAKTLHVNVMYLGQVFKKETGKSFSKYLNHYRINLAKELLLQSKEPVNDIADRIGYRNQGYFYKNFKNLVGQSPGEFREQIL